MVVIGDSAGLSQMRQLLITTPVFSLYVFSMAFSYILSEPSLVVHLWLGVAKSSFSGKFKHWNFLYYDSRINNFPRIDAVLGPLGVDGGERVAIQ